MASNRIQHPLVSRFHKTRSSRRGVTIVLVVMLLVLLQVAVLGTLASAARQVDLMAVTSQSAQAYYTAEGLLQRGAREVVKNLDEDANGTVGTIGASGSGSSVAVTTSGNDSVLTSTVQIGDAVRSLQSRWTVTPATVAGGNLLAEYYRLASAPSALASINWSGTRAALGALRDINFSNEVSGSFPMWQGGPTSNWAIRVTGNIVVTTAGSYTFSIASDDGSDFAINGVTLINNDRLQSITAKSGTTVLAAGTHPFVARMFEAAVSHAFLLYWQPPGASSLTLVPPSAMTGSGPVAGVTVHGAVTMNADTNLTGWSRGGSSGGPALVSNSTTTNTVELSDRARVTGDIQTGVGGTPAQVIKIINQAVITGSTTALTTPAGIERVSTFATLPTSLGALTLAGSTALALSSSTTRYASLSITQDSVITVTGDCVLIIDGALSMQDRGNIILNTGAKLRLYIGTTFSMIDDSKLNSDTTRTLDLLVLMSGVSQTATLTGRAQLCGTLLNPRGTLSAAQDMYMYGNAELTTLTMTDRAVIYADITATSFASGSATATFVSWSDLTTPN